MDIPNAGSHFSLTKKGYLQKLSSRSFPYIPHPWKRKFCVLVKGQLFYYEKEDSKGADKGCGVINLEYYDQVVEAPSKECKKATNVFVLTSQDRSFFDPGRHLFSAESPKELQEWMRLLKRAIEQIRNNNRTAAAVAGAGSFLSPSSPRPSGGDSKGGGGASKGGGALGGREKKKEEVEEDGQGKRKKEQELENKENLEDWTNSKDRKQKISDTSLRRRKGNPSSRSMDESSLGGADNLGKGSGTNSFGRKKGAGVHSDTEPNSGPNSLGRKLGGKSGKPGPDFNRFGGGGGGQASDVEGMMFGSLGRQSKVEGTSTKGSAGGVSGDSGCSGSGGSGNVERRKRKADDDGYEEEGGGAMETPESGPQLESVTKHRVKGPAGRRMPQNRRTQHLMMKQRASSLSALAHNADNAQNPDNPAASFVPWLNRSLDLLGEEQLVPASRNSQPALGFLYSDQDDIEEDQLYEYNIGFNAENLSFEENGGLYIQEDGSFILQQHPDAFGNLNMTGSGGMPPPPPPLPPRMEFSSGQQTSMQISHPYQLQQHQQLQQQLQQMQIHASIQQQQQNQLCSPFGTASQASDHMSDRELKNRRRSKHLDEMNGDGMMTRSMTNELFIASYSDDNSCNASNPQLHRSQEHQRRQRVGSPNSGSPSSQSNGKPRSKSAAAVGGKPNPQKGNNRKPMSQPDINRFTVAVRNLQKHVVELDQAVNEITKEVEDSKVDLGSIRSNLVTVKKDKDRLQDAISIINQEASKIKDQVIYSLKETEKLQKSATAALVVAEKAKMDQQALKKEYEGMLRDLKTAIEAIKRDALKSLSADPSPAVRKRGDRDECLEAVESEEEEDEDSEMEEAKGTVRRNVTVQRTKSKESNRGSSSKLNEGSKNEGKSSGYQSFFSRPSSILSGLTNRSSMAKSTTSIDGPDKNESPNKSKEKSKQKASSKSDSKSTDKKTKKEKTAGVKTSKEHGSPEQEKSKKFSRNLSDDFPMMDETGSPRTLSPTESIPDITNEDPNQNNNYSLLKSTSSPTVPSRPKALNLSSQKSETKASSATNSPDSPTRPSSPFDMPKLHLNGRATSPTGFALHRPGSTPGPMIRQGSMTTVPEDRAIDARTFDNRPTDPPPPPPTNRVFAISRQSSTPNIATQKSTSPLVLQRQHSLGIVPEENKSPISRQSSVMSMPDDRLLVDQTLPMSPTSSMLSFPGSWSTTSLNRQDSNLALANGSGSTDLGSELSLSNKSPTSPKGRPRGALEQVAGGVLSGSSLRPGIICPLDETGDDPPLATSSLKRRKKVKKDPVVV